MIKQPLFHAVILTLSVNIIFASSYLAPPAGIVPAGMFENPGKSWIDTHIPMLTGKTIVSLSMEGNIPEFEGLPAQNANTKGGLGAYFGDKLEGLADIGMQAYGIQPGYSTALRNSKHTHINYQKLAEEGLIEPVMTGKDTIMVRAWSEDSTIHSPIDEDNPLVPVEVYTFMRGGTRDFILVSPVFDVLYTDDRRHRFTQEIVFGKAVYEFLKRINLIPDILHLNEAHTVVAAAQMRADPDDRFKKTAINYTVHTNIPAGLEMFSAADLNTNIKRMFYVIGLPEKNSLKYRSQFLRTDGVVDFCYAAITLADTINGVSREHARAAENLFRKLYGKDFDVHVVGVLNGSGRSWKNEKLLEAESTGDTPDEDELWAIHDAGKREAFEEIRSRTHIKLNHRKPTAWMVRRLVDYKSQYPILRFLVHIMTADRSQTYTRAQLKKLWFDDIPALKESMNKEVVDAVLNRMFYNRTVIHGLGMQIVVGGPEYEPFWVEEFIRWTYHVPALEGRFVYVPHSDAKLLKMQAIGSDICMTFPRPLEEACGTSDQRSGLNGGINIALHGAGPIEWMEEYDPETGNGNGFFIESYTTVIEDRITPNHEQFYKEAPADLLAKAKIAATLFYRKEKTAWKRLMHNAYHAANKIVSATAMEMRYAREAYLPALLRRAAAIESNDRWIIPALRDTSRVLLTAT